MDEGNDAAARLGGDLRKQLDRGFRAALLAELSANLAHRINQPLAAILANAQAARRFIIDGGIGRDDMLSILDDIIRDNKRASETIHQAALSFKSHAALRETCDLNALVGAVGESLAPELAMDGIQLQQTFVTPAPQVRASMLEIQQVIYQLLTNARQAMATTTPESRHIMIETTTCDACAVVRIIDRGCGVPQDRADHLFKPFHGNGSDGPDLGLAICARIVAAHGGSISAANRPEGGAVFAFTLPLAGYTDG